MTEPNVLLVTIDSLRADHVYGDAADTPRLDDLAADGVSYRTAIAQGPYTTFSMPSLFASRYPSGLEYVEISDVTAGVSVEDVATVAEAFSDSGFDTAGFHSNPLLSQLFGFGDGFDAFDARLPFSGTNVLPGRAKVFADKLRRLFRLHPYLPATKVNRRALDWLDGRGDERPFFLWLHYMDVHGPYRPATGNRYLQKYRSERRWRQAVHNPEVLGTEERELLHRDYVIEVERVDTAIGELLDGLSVRGLRDDLVVAVTADHGEGFGEHGSFSHPHELYDELLRVPLVLDRPGETAHTVERPVELLDLVPTLCRWADIEPPETMRGDPLHSGSVEGWDDTIGADGNRTIAEADLFPEYHGCVRTARWKYVRRGDAGSLYDLEADDGETSPVEGHGTVAERLARVLHDHLSRDDQREASDANEVAVEDRAVVDRLNDLGYLE